MGRLKILVDRYPLSAAKQAYDDFEHGRLVGRAVLMPEPGAADHDDLGAFQPALRFGRRTRVHPAQAGGRLLYGRLSQAAAQANSASVSP